jgi:hypothetical protein
MLPINDEVQINIALRWFGGLPENDLETPVNRLG